MSKVNFNDLDDFFEEEGYDVCSSCGGTDFEFDDEYGSFTLCSECGARNGATKIKIKKPKKKGKEYGDDIIYPYDGQDY